MISYSMLRKGRVLFFIVATTFFIVSISILISLMSYNYADDWTLLKANTKIEDNVMYVKNDDGSQTMANPLSIMFPNHTSKIDIDVYSYSHSFKYEILRGAIVNPEEHFIVYYFWREGDIDDLPINYEIPNDNHIYKIVFLPIESNNLTFVAVNVNYEYYMKGLNGIYLINITDILLYILISLFILSITLFSITNHLQNTFIQDPLLIDKLIKDKDLNRKLKTIVYKRNIEVDNNKLIYIIERIGKDDYINALKDIYPFIELIMNEIIEKHGRKVTKDIFKKDELLIQLGYLEDKSYKKELFIYRNLISHGQEKEVLNRRNDLKAIVYNSLDYLDELLKKRL